MILPVIWKVPRGRQSVVLTFDDGPHPEITPALVDVLSRHNARAVFFLVGKRAEEMPELVRMLQQNGHEIGSHGYLHRRDVWRSPGVLERDLIKAQEVFHAQGVPVHLFRPPHGWLSPSWYMASRRMGYDCVLWNLASRDWAVDSADYMHRRVMKRLRPGRVVLLHECRAQTGEPYHHTVQGVDRILTDMSQMNIRTETISDWRGK